LPDALREDCVDQATVDCLPEVRVQAQRDTAFRFQRREWFREQLVGKIIRRILERRRRLLRWRMRLPLSQLPLLRPI